MSPWLRPRSPTSTTASSLDFLIKTVRVRPLPSFLWLAASFLGEAKPTAPQKTTPNATTKARRTNTLLLLNATCVPLSKGEGEAHRPRRVLCTTRSKHKRSRDPAPRAHHRATPEKVALSGSYGLGEARARNTRRVLSVSYVRWSLN